MLDGYVDNEDDVLSRLSELLLDPEVSCSPHIGSGPCRQGALHARGRVEGGEASRGLRDHRAREEAAREDAAREAFSVLREVRVLAGSLDILAATSNADERSRVVGAHRSWLSAALTAHSSLTSMTGLALRF